MHCCSWSRVRVVGPTGFNISSRDHVCYQGCTVEASLEGSITPSALTQGLVLYEKLHWPHTPSVVFILLYSDSSQFH